MLVKNKVLWDIDLILCVLLVLITPYSIYDLLARSATGTSLFQTSWIIICVCIIRLTLIILSRQKTRNRRINFSFRKHFPLILILFYTLLPTLWFLIELESSEYLRHDPTKFVLSRGIKFTAYLCLSIYISIVLKNRQRIEIVIRFLAFGLCIAELLAILQLIIFQATKVNIFPIVRTGSDGWQYFDSVISFAGQSFLRINSISHEPKGLAALLCLLFIVKVFWKEFNYEFSPELHENQLDTYMQKTLWLTGLLALMTFSNNAILMLGFILALVSILGLLKMHKITVKKAHLIIFLFGASIVLLLLIEYSDNLYQVFSSFLDATINRRLGPSISGSEIQGSVDPEDGAVFYIFNNYPWYSLLRGFGFGGFSNSSYPFVSAQYGREQVSPFSRNILIELFFSSGLIGITLVFYFFKKNVLRYMLKGSAIHSIFGIFLLNNFFLRSSEILFFTSLGILVAFQYLEKYTKPYDYNSSHLYSHLE